MNKPMSVARAEFMGGLVRLINESGLPFFVIEPILKEVHSTVEKEAERIYLVEKQQYEEALEKAKQEAEKEEGEVNG